MAILKINGTDYSANTIVGSYYVNDNEIYKSWNDANGRFRRDITRHQVTGSFEMQFGSIGTYNQFLNHLEESKNEDGSIQCEVYVNNLGIMKAGEFYLRHESTLTRVNNNTKNYIDKFTMEISEK